MVTLEDERPSGLIVSEKIPELPHHLILLTNSVDGLKVGHIVRRPVRLFEKVIRLVGPIYHSGHLLKNGQQATWLSKLLVVDDPVGRIRVKLISNVTDWGDTNMN